MKKAFIVTLIVISLFLIMGCSAPIQNSKLPNEPIDKTNSDLALCKSPYIEFKKGECCVDQNNNDICDNDEQTILETSSKIDTESTTVIVEASQNKPDADTTLLKQMLNEVPEGYVYKLDKGTFIYAVSSLGNKRSIGEYSDYTDNVYWDVNTNEVLLWAGEIPKSWWCKRKNLVCEDDENHMGAGEYLPAFFKLKLTRNREQDRNIIPDELKRWYWWSPFEGAALGKGELDKTLWVEFFYDKNPVEWMEEYKDEKPIKIEHTKLVLSSSFKQIVSNLSIHFNHKTYADRKIIFRFNTNIKVPTHIEEVERGITVRRYVYYFETTYYKDAYTKWPITSELVDPPENHIIINFEDRREYDEFLEGSIKCISNQDCREKEVCYRGGCIKAECRTDSDCSRLRPFCDTSKEWDYHCVECLTNSDCSSDKHCTTGKCVIN